jgi:hypothetical protein
MSTTPPQPKWTDKTKAMYADWFVDCYYYEPADCQYYARRSDADAYEQWKPVAAALGVWRTQEIDIPDDVEQMIWDRYKSRGEAAP